MQLFPSTTTPGGLYPLIASSLMTIITPKAAGVDRVVTMDLHAPQVQGFFRIPVDHMVAVPMFAQHIRDYLGTDVDRVAAGLARRRLLRGPLGGVLLGPVLLGDVHDRAGNPQYGPQGVLQLPPEAIAREVGLACELEDKNTLGDLLD